MIRILIFLNMCLIIFSCTDIGRYPDFVFEIVNESDYNINISFLNRNNLKDEINIEKKNKFSIKRDKCSSSCVPTLSNPDSIVIKFEDKRKLIQSCGGKFLFGNFGLCYYEKNIMDQARWKSSRKGFKEIRTMIFDNKDYEKAIPL